MRRSILLSIAAVVVILVVAVLVFTVGGVNISGKSTYEIKERAQAGDSVNVAYTIKVEGVVKDTSESLIFTVGDGVVKNSVNFDDAVTGLTLGGTKEGSIVDYGTGAGTLSGKSVYYKIELLSIN